MPNKRSSDSEGRLEIRRATRKDIAGMRKVFLSAYHARYAAAGEFYSSSELVDANYGTSTGPYYSRRRYVEENVRSIARRLRAPFACWVAERDKQLAGYIITERHAGKLWVNDVLVAKGEQRSGVGGQLVGHALGDANEVYLWVNSANPALAFWRKLGFRTVLRETLMNRRRGAKKR